MKMDAHRETPDIFKTCPMCGHRWHSRQQLLEDPCLQLVGYQVSFKALTSGLFLFNHLCKGATLALPASAFSDLYAGSIFKERFTGSQSCPGHCLYQDDLEPCPRQCECAYVRHIINIIKCWPKTKATPKVAGERIAVGV
jgi:hypothetical protein